MKRKMSYETPLSVPTSKCAPSLGLEDKSHSNERNISDLQIEVGLKEKGEL